VGVLPAFIVFWIVRAVPEPEEWRRARDSARDYQPKIRELFQGDIRPVTLWVILVCGVSLTAHWAFMFWHQQQLRNLPEVLGWTAEQKNKLATLAMYWVIGSSILGNFFAAWLARRLGYRATIASLFLAYFVVLTGAYCVPRDHAALLCWFPLIGICQGSFALFTMYLPPLFPTLLRTTGAGFCYNIGRVTSAFGTVFFGLFSHGLGDHRLTLLYAGFLFLPAAVIALFLPRARD
jgi:MFS family permease